MTSHRSGDTAANPGARCALRDDRGPLGRRKCGSSGMKGGARERCHQEGRPGRLPTTGRFRSSPRDPRGGPEDPDPHHRLSCYFQSSARSSRPSATWMPAIHSIPRPPGRRDGGRSPASSAVVYARGIGPGVYDIHFHRIICRRSHASCIQRSRSGPFEPPGAWVESRAAGPRARHDETRWHRYECSQ
jgi:hypothetical protein